MIEKLKTINPYDETEIDMDTDSVAGLVYENTLLIQKINELIDAVNKHEDIIRQIGEWGSSKGECLWCENLTEANLYDNSEKANCQGNVQDHMIGCTTLGIPKSYKNDQLTLATLDYSKKLEKENSDLKDELDRTRKELEIALDALTDFIIFPVVQKNTHKKL